MHEKTNYGKIIAITLAVIAATSVIAIVIAKLLRNVIAFCNTYSTPEDEVDTIEIDELEEDVCDGEEAAADTTEA